MHNPNEHEATRLRELAESLDCLTDADLQLLADAEGTTIEAWRKRGRGPAYALVGNRYLYPRARVAEWLQANIRERRAMPAKTVL